MEDKRNLTMGLQFSVADAMDSLSEILGYIQRIKGGFQDAEEEGSQFGSTLAKEAGAAQNGLEHVGMEARQTAASLTGISHAGDDIRESILDSRIAFDRMGNAAKENAADARSGLRSAAQAADGLTDAYLNVGTAAESEMIKATGAADQASEALEDILPAGEEVKKTYRQIGAAADSFSLAVISSSRDAMRETDSFGTAIKAGIQGAYGYAGKQVDQFTKKTKSGFQAIQTAVRHPIQTIKTEFQKALENAGKKLEDVGEEAEDAGEKVRREFQKAGSEIDDVGQRANKSERDLKDMGDSGESAGSRIKSAVGSAVTSFFAISAAIELVQAGIEVVKSFGTAILEAGTSAEKTGAQFNALFSDDSGVREWAENYSSAIHRSNTEVQSFLASNKTMYQELGITGQAANDLSRITTSLAYDIGSAFKMEDAEALSLMQDYLKGNTEALAAYGIQIDEAALKQSSMAMGLGSSIDSLNDAAMAQVRMNALLEQTTQLQQAAAKEQTGYTNSIKSLKGIWNDFLTSAGSKFEPVFTKLSNTILTSWPQIEPALSGFIDMLSNGLAAGIPVITDLAVSSIPSLVQTIGEVAGAAAPMGELLLNLATTVLPPLASAATPLISTFGTLAQTVLPPLSRVISSIATTAVPPLVNILQSLSENVIAPLMPHIESIANAILPALSAGLKLIPPILQTISPILEGIAGILSRVVGFLSKIVEWAAGGIGTVLNKVAGLFGGGGGSNGNDIPHNADGDPSFPGGWTHINERGGELAYLPSGSAIIPADKSEQILSGGTKQQGPVSMSFTITVPITVNGNADSGLIAELEARIRQTLRETVQEMQEEAAMNLAIQQGNA